MATSGQHHLIPNDGERAIWQVQEQTSQRVSSVGCDQYHRTEVRLHEADPAPLGA